MKLQFPPVDFPPITTCQIKQYAEASGDHNPIHLDPDFAQAAGLPQVIAHGMLSMGIAARALSTWGFESEQIKRFESKFKEKVFPGEALRAVCTKALESDQGIELHWKLYKRGEVEVLSASALLNPEKPA